MMVLLDKDFKMIAGNMFGTVKKSARFMGKLEEIHKMELCTYYCKDIAVNKTLNKIF